MTHLNIHILNRLRLFIPVLAGIFAISATDSDSFMGAPKSGWRDSVLCTVGRDMAELDLQVVNDARQWQLMWNVTDSSYNALSIKRLNSFDDGVYSDKARVRLSEMQTGNERVIAEEEVSYSGPLLGLRLTVGDGLRRVLASDGKPLFRDVPVPATIAEDSRAILRTPTKANFRVLRAEASHYLDRRNTKFNTISELDDYLAASRDSVEGYWEYLDRNVQAKAVSLGAPYRLATVRNGDAIDVLYLGPVDSPAQAWQPLMVKGRLIPTIFINNYDLEWADNRRLTLYNSETYATLEARCTILTLNFPLFRSSFRFRRIFPNKH